ncbi:MAG: tryptophan-rich sensory protein [Clostridium sp.]|nr:tryptophan-rich sensory protein [Clostridium sp.]
MYLIILRGELVDSRQYKENREKNIGDLIISIIIAEGVGILGGILGMTNSINYMEFKKPSFSPPSCVFPIVWTILYLFMGIAAYRVWIKGKQGEKITKAGVLYIIQLILNFLWPIIFFRFELYGVAFFELLLLLVIVIMTAFEFYKIDKIAGYLMIPYILWLLFAGVLNYSIWMLNK